MEKKSIILIIDDEEGIRDSCSQVLRKCGYVVAVSSNGYDGLEKVTQLKPDLVLLDLKMPGLSGMEVLDRIKQIAPDIVVIVITGFATIESAVEAIKKGAYDFLPKPFKSEELKVIVQRGLERRGLILEAVQLKEEKKRMEKNFISMVSHQLKAPLANILQYFEVILQGTAGELNPKQTEILKKQQKNVSNLLKLINDWLNMVRISNEEIKSKFEPINLASIFEKIIEECYLLAVKDNITIKIDGLNELPNILGVPCLLEEAFKNIVNNAIKYNKPGGEVLIKGLQRDEFIEISIKDSGIGIEEQNLPYIFDEFFRVNPKAHPDKTGTGLGLTITKKIIEAHLGSISVISKFGEGTTFVVLLPLVKRE